ncbi:MAG: hydrogenase iron-sulfur subunit [Haliscomenobacteraceae bacterium CHB4]|nr:Cytochrome b6 [Saprospiraceae bacterium]MCE7924560.1 hydrogenase iron-sulfur subunit [Haliscomenobacteraceae bacterium CHB4]
MNGHQYYQRWAKIFSRIYSSKLNPLYHLGGMAIFMFIVACVSGVYLFLFYNVDPSQAYASVQQISANPFNGWMRTIHRYSSDLLVIFILLHLGHTVFTGKYRRVLSWQTGVISFLVVVFIGVTGFILVWDQKAKLLGFLTAKFFSAVPVFDPSIAGAFLINNLDYLSGFFKVSLFGHVFFSLAVVIILWLHVARISGPKLFMPRQLVYLAMGALTIVCIIFPVESDPPAQDSFLPQQTTFDWYYFFGYYLLKLFSTQANWVIMLGSGLALALIPYLRKKDRKKSPIATIDLAKCDACNLCSYDCPYDAIDMLIREGERKAILDPAKCVGCGICIGSCKEYAITLPGYPAIERSALPVKCDLAVFSCSQFAPVLLPPELDVKHYEVPCIGSVYAKDIEKILQNQAHGVVMLSCEDCFYRKGKTWAQDRLMRVRPPAFSKKLPAGSVALLTFSHYKQVTEEIRSFAKKVKAAGTKDADMTPFVLDWKKFSPALAFGVMLLFFLLMPLFSATQVSFFDGKNKTLLLSFKYISSPTDVETPQTSGRHMQSATPIVTRRSPVEVIVTEPGGKVIFQKTWSPRGLRHDIAIYVFAEINAATEQVHFSLNETDVPGKKIEMRDITLTTADATLLTFQDGKFVLQHSKAGGQ